MENKIYNFYVLFDEQNPEDIRYVGTTTKKINERFAQHKYCAMHPEKRGLPVHKWMYSKYKNGGKIGFKKIDECSEEDWEEREKYWISYYKSQGFNLMNLDKGGKGIITKEKRSISSIERSIKGHEKAVIALNKDGSFYKEFESASKATKELGLKSNSAIGNVLSGRSKSSAGYLWVFKDDYDENKNYSYNPDYLNKRIKVYSFYTNGNLDKEYPYIKIFDEIGGFSENGVRAAIKNKKIYHNRFWSYEPIINISEYDNGMRFKVTCPDGDILYFSTQKEVKNFLNISESSLRTQMKDSVQITIKNYKIERI